MKLHFDFHLAHFRFDRMSLESESKATVYGSSNELGGCGYFKLSGEEKISAFTREIQSKLDKQNPEFLLLYSGKTIFAVSLIPSNCPKDCSSINMNSLDYLLVHEGTNHMNGLMNLETLNVYMDYWMDKFGPSPLD